MWKNRENLKRVETWYDTPTEISSYALQRTFETATGIGSPISYFFADIWIPLGKRDPVTHAIIPGEYTYQNVGFTTEQLTDIYWAQYRSLFIAEPLDTTDNSTVSVCTAHLAKIIKAVLIKNKFKYLKWMDEMGYAYNPLWNVDGVEEYQWIDNHGDIVKKDTPILEYTQLNKTVSYETDSELRGTSSVETTYGGTYMDGTTPTVGTSTSENTKDMYSTSEEKHNNITDDSISGIIKSITGGDYSHIEKRLRQGNIGVTKSTELIESERELVRFNLLQEFFNDINKEILIGIYI